MQTGSYLLRSCKELLRAPGPPSISSMLPQIVRYQREGLPAPRAAARRVVGPAGPWPSRGSLRSSAFPLAGQIPARSYAARPVSSGTHTDMSYGACSVSGTPGRLHAECQSGRTRRRRPASRSIRRALTVSGACTAWPTASSRQGHDRQRGAMPPPAGAPTVWMADTRLRHY